MEPPVIRIQDTDTALPALTAHYPLGSHSLDTLAIHTAIHTLSTHPGRAHLNADGSVTPCSAPFLTSFWSAAASLTDYFATCYPADTPLMHSLWFHLLDTWQAASPATLYRRDMLYSQAMPSSSRLSADAHAFERDYTDTLVLLQRLCGQPQHCEPLVHAPGGTVEGEAGTYKTGPWVSGLKPWQQFLYAGAPGFRPATLGARDGETDGDADADADADARVDDLSTRYIPQPAIALIAAHTARARTLCARTSSTALSTFDASALLFPSSPHDCVTVPSQLRPGTAYTYSLLCGAPPVARHEGVGDVSMLVEEPGFVLLDEAVGSCRGVEGYVPMTGVMEGEGVGFDVWGVRGGEGVGVLGGEMFDDWVGE